MGTVAISRLFQPQPHRLINLVTSSLHSEVQLRGHTTPLASVRSPESASGIISGAIVEDVSTPSPPECSRSECLWSVLAYVNLLKRHAAHPDHLYEVGVARNHSAFSLEQTSVKKVLLSTFKRQAFSSISFNALSLAEVPSSFYIAVSLSDSDRSRPADPVSMYPSLYIHDW